jgi:hypothetical protein
VPGGGLTPSQKWKPCKYQKKYLFPKRALSMVFRAKYMAALTQLGPSAQKSGKISLFFTSFFT